MIFKFRAGRDIQNGGKSQFNFYCYVYFKTSAAVAIFKMPDFNVRLQQASAELSRPTRHYTV